MPGLDLVISLLAQGQVQNSRVGTEQIPEDQTVLLGGGGGQEDGKSRHGLVLTVGTLKNRCFRRASNTI